MAKRQLFVISLGGSLVVPEEVDEKFLREFKNLILRGVTKGQRFVLIVGGGKICRKYQKALSAVAKSGQTQLDWLGIYSTRFNAQLVRLMFGKLAHARVIEDPNKKVVFRESILVAGGWMPGRSTDDDAVRLAKVYNSKTIINLSNIDYLYTKDPRKFKDTKPIPEISWKDYRKMAGNSWSPGAHVPFDVIASKFAAKEKQKVIIANGKDLKNLAEILSGKKFKGTIIG